jgi:RNA recognition motif-containing protein
MNIYVGNLSYDATDDDLRKAFEAYGEVVGVNVIRDKNTGRSRGFGFVEMATEEAGQAAIEGLNGSELLGRNLNVNMARPRADRPDGRGGRE